MRTTKRQTVPTLFLLGALMLNACDDSSSDSEDQEAEQEEMHHDDGGAGATSTAGVCDDVEFRLEMIAEGREGRLQAMLLEASPSPPLRNENDWRIEFQDTEGEIVDDVEILDATPFMPEHAHDGTFAPTVTALEEPGQFQLEALNLWMPGMWEIRLTVRSEDLGEDYIVFDACIEE